MRPPARHHAGLGVDSFSVGMDTTPPWWRPRLTRDKSIGHIGHLKDLDGTGVVWPTRPQSVRNVIFPASNADELVASVLCKQRVTGSSPVRSIQILATAFGHAGGGVSFRRMNA